MVITLRIPQNKAAPNRWSSPFFDTTKKLCNVYLTLNLLHFFLVDLWHGDGQHAVVNLGCNVVFDDILRQHIHLLIVGVVELASQISAIRVPMFDDVTICRE